MQDRRQRGPPILNVVHFFFKFAPPQGRKSEKIHFEGGGLAHVLSIRVSCYGPAISSRLELTPERSQLCVLSSALRPAG